MKSILFVCDSYGDYSSPNGICIRKIALEAISEGYRVFIVAKQIKYKEKLHENLEGIEIYRIKTSWLETKINNAKRGSFWEKMLLKLSSLNGAFHMFSYPKLYQHEVKNYYEKIKQIVAANDIKIVVCVYKQIHAVLASIKLKKKLKESITLVTYTLDSISGGAIPSICRIKSIPAKSILRWEKYIFDNSNYIYLMESHRQHYHNEKYIKYWDKFVFVDIPLLENNRKAQRHLLNRDACNIVFTGSMSENTANPITWLSFLNSCDLNIVFNVYGPIDGKLQKRISSLKLNNKNIFFHGVVDHQTAIKMQENADILINFGNSNKNMIPCKIFEYISRGKKIISISPSLSDPSIFYLKNYPNALILFEEDFKEKNVKNTISTFIRSSLDSSSVFDNPIFKKCYPSYFFECLKMINKV